MIKNFRIAFALAVASLTVASAYATEQTPVALGSNSTFAILAGTTVTVTGGGTITGNIGISPGAAFAAGTPAVTVNGTLYAGGPVAAQAQADLTTAFNDAAGRQTPVAVAGNIGGQTLTPGLYKSTSSLAISSGDLTLDAQGNANAVFIFQIASSLTLTSGRKVILAGGANPANIFWQVGSSATLGTTSVLHGNVLASISISILTGATLNGRALAQSGAVSLDTGGGTSVIVPVAPTLPTVTSTIPALGAIGVAIGNKLSATFSEPMNPATLTISTFLLTQGGVAVPGSVSYAGTTAIFTPLANLASSAPFTATITTGAKTPAGNSLAANYVWAFATGSGPDNIRPSVISSVPGNAENGVPVGNKLSAVFNKAMDPSTINASTFTLVQGATPVAGTVTYVGLTATFTPNSVLAAGVAFTATITTGAKDLSGTAVAANYSWNFATGSSPDTSSPSVSFFLPASNATGIATNTTLTAQFSKVMDPLTINTSTFTLQQGATRVGGTVSYVGTTATFTPFSALLALSPYSAVITTGVKDLAGNALANPLIWTFTTASGPRPVPVILPAGTANNTTGTVSDASFTSPVAAGSIAAVFGTNLSVGQSNSAIPTPLPNFLNETYFFIGDRSAPIFFLSPGQANIQIPWELAGSTLVPINASVAGVVSTGQFVVIANYAPGIFTTDASGSGQGAILISNTTQLAAPASPVQRGGFISIYCTGLGPVTNQPVSGAAAAISPLALTFTGPIVTVGGVAAAVTYSGLAPTLVGLYQVNVKVPEDAATGSAVPVTLSIGGVTSNTVTIAVR